MIKTKKQTNKNQQRTLLVEMDQWKRVWRSRDPHEESTAEAPRVQTRPVAKELEHGGWTGGSEVK